MQVRNPARMAALAATGPARPKWGVERRGLTSPEFVGAVQQKALPVDAGSGTCTGTLVINTTATATGTPATDWACTKDNVTNLIWSLQLQSRTWSDAAGSSFPDAGHNAVARCGYSTGWRLPTRRELLSIVDNSRTSPAIDTNYFNGASGRHWSSDINVSGAWAVFFSDGSTSSGIKSSPFSVRLVRSGQ